MSQWDSLTHSAPFSPPLQCPSASPDQSSQYLPRRDLKKSWIIEAQPTKKRTCIWILPMVWSDSHHGGSEILSMWWGQRACSLNIFLLIWRCFPFRKCLSRSAVSISWCLCKQPFDVDTTLMIVSVKIKKRKVYPNVRWIGSNVLWCSFWSLSNK